MSSSLKNCKAAFYQLLNGLNSNEAYEFINWIKEADEFNVTDNADVGIDKIALELREKLPFDAILPSEDKLKQNSGKILGDENYTHVDEFLFTDDDIDDLVDEGKFSRNFCVRCGSRETKPLVFISHSMSKAMMKSIFKSILPDLTGKTIVDIGSRLGAVLYGAFYYSNAEQILGIEMNRDFCELQANIIERHGLSKRIGVVNDDVLNCQKQLLQADVVVMHNVFEHFADVQKQHILWTFILNTLKKNCILITVPSLQESLGNIGMPFDIESWADEREINDSEHDFGLDLRCYHVK